MKVILRLYRQHDLDLLYLHMSKKFSMQKNVKLALRAYINKEQLVIQIPDVTVEKKLPKSSQFHIVLSETEDADIIKWLGTISKGYRNSLIKNILRHYMSEVMLLPYIEGNPVKYTPVKSTSETKEETLKKGKAIAKQVLDNPLIKENKSVELEEGQKYFEKTDAKAKETLHDKPESISESESNENTDVDFDLFGEFDSMIKKF